MSCPRRGPSNVVIARHDRVIAAAERHRVRHVIYTSLTGSGDHLAFALAHRWTERRLQRSSLDWTILRNGLYAELFGQLAMPTGGVIIAPVGDGALAAVARDDLAEAAATVAADPAAHRNRVYELSGTGEITGAELARRLGASYRPTSLREARAAMAPAGLLPFQPPMLMSIFSATASGFLGRTRTDLEELLPGPPRDTLEVAARAPAG